MGQESDIQDHYRMVPKEYDSIFHKRTQLSSSFNKGKGHTSFSGLPTKTLNSLQSPEP